MTAVVSDAREGFRAQWAHDEPDWTVLSEALPLADLLLRTAERTPEATALVIPTEEFTYAELRAESIDVARGLLSLGVERGDHVGVLAPNSIEYVAALFGASLIGAVVVPLHVRATSRELAYLIPHAELRVILTTDRISEHVDFRQRMHGALRGLAESDASRPLDLSGAPLLRHVVMLRGNAGGGALGRTQFNEAVELVTAADVARVRTRVRIRDASLILYTSGTTSNPKGCVISHEAISRGSVARISAAVPPAEIAGPLVMWHPLPLFHIAALQAFVYVVATGATLVTDVHLDADRALDLIRRHRANSLWSGFMPPMRTLRTANGFDAAELSWVHSIWTVGPEAEMIELQELFPQAELVSGGGMSETTGWFCITPRGDLPLHRRTTSGTPVAGAELRVVDPETGKERPAGERGELLVRTYTLMDGYFREPERTAEVIDSDGWMHTGDLYTRLESGHYVYEGRIKDMLKVGGENVPAIEIEAYLCGHPDILTAEVVGVPEPRLDEVPVAFIELVDGAEMSVQDVLDYCAGELATFKIPRRVHFVEAGGWPLSATKVNKRVLRDDAIRASAD
ncbi:class I adenylate-forming enzyme family protein [Agromyces sp. NPDC049794]|uniref:class I adenylate-forming enzyme family protein n=1 Tax=unclassified Agromyces TaxID=2639701 RepID=UPI0033D895C7